MRNARPPRRLRQPRPLLGGAAHVAAQPRDPAEPPHRRAGGVAIGKPGGDLPVHAGRLAVAAGVVEHARGERERLGHLRLGAARRDERQQPERALVLSRADQHAGLLQPQPRPLLDRGVARGQLDGARGRIEATQARGGVGHDAERAQDDAGVARLGGDRLRLVGGRLRDAALQQALRAVDPLAHRDRRQRGAALDQHGQAVARGLRIRGRRREDAELTVREGGDVGLLARFRRLADEVQGLGHLGRVRVALEQPLQRRVRAGLVTRPRCQRGGAQQRAGGQPAVRVAVGHGESGRPGAFQVTPALEGVGAEIASVVPDGAGQGRLGAELTGQRPGIALLERGHRLRPRLLSVRGGRRRCSRRDRQQRGDHHEPDCRADGRAALPQSPPREEDALQRGQIGKNGQRPEGGLHEPEQRTGDEADQALRPLHHPYVTRNPDGLGPCLRVADHDGPGQAGHGHEGAARVRHLRVEDHDAEHDHDVRVAVDHRVEEGAEGRDLPRGARQRAVEQVEEAGDDQEDAGGPDLAEDEGRPGARAHQQPAHGQVVRAQLQPEQEAPHRIAPGADRVAIAAQHQIGCRSACSRADRTRSIAAGSSRRRPLRSST